jgi:hypothetical protein
MSIRVMSEVWRTKLPTSEKMVLLVIADHASDEGDNAWPSQATIATRASCTIRTVQRCVNNLVREGYLRMEKGAGGSVNCREDRRPHRYTINLKRLRGDKMTGRQPDSDEASSTTDTGRLSRPMNHPLEPSIETHFDLFWKAYPKKIAKKAAIKAWTQAIKDTDPKIIIASAEAFAKDKTRQDAFTAYPATWLNAGRWMDEVTVVKTPVIVDKYDPKEEEQRRAKAVPMPQEVKDLLAQITNKHYD